MVLKSPVAKAASVAAMMSVIAVPFAVLSQPAPVHSAALYSIHDVTLAKGTEKTINASHLGPFRVNSSVSSVVYATYSSAPKFIHLRGDQEGPSVITVTDEANGSIVEQFKVHVLDAGADKRIDIGDVTKYIASHPSDVTQASDVRTLLNGIEPFNAAGQGSKVPEVVGQPGAVTLINGQTGEPQKLSMATYFKDDTTLFFDIVAKPDYLTASMNKETGELVVYGANNPLNETRTDFIKITATNIHGKSSTLTVEVKIQAKETPPVNTPPAVVGTPEIIRLINGYSNGPQTVNMATYFNDSTKLRYELLSKPYYLDASLNEETGELIINGESLPDDEPRAFYLEVTATNKHGLSATIYVHVSIEIPPTFLYNQHSPMPVLGSLRTLFVDIAASQFEITQAPEAGLIATIQNNGHIDANILFQGTAKNSFLKVKGTNPATGASKEVLIRFKVNYHPALVDASVQPIVIANGASVNVSRDVKGLFKDEAGQELVYTIDEARSESPYGLRSSISEGTLQIEGITEVLPSEANFKIAIKATDPYGLSNGRTIDLKVAHTPHGNLVDPVEWIHGVTESSVLHASDYFSFISDLEYSIEAPETIKASINKKTGKILIESVDYSVTGDVNVIVTATNALGSSATVNIPLHIKQSIPILWKSEFPFPYMVDVTSHFNDTGIARFDLIPYSNSNVNTRIIRNNDQTQLEFSGNPPIITAADTLIKVIAFNDTNQPLKELFFYLITDYPVPKREGTISAIRVTNGEEIGETFRPYLPYYFPDQNVSFDLLPFENKDGNIIASIQNGFLQVTGAYFPDNNDIQTELKVKVTNNYNKSAIETITVNVNAKDAHDTLVFQDGISTSYKINLNSLFFKQDVLRFDVINEIELRNVYNINASIDGPIYVENVGPIYNSEVKNLAVDIRATDEFGQSTLLQIPIQINPVTK